MPLGTTAFWAIVLPSEDTNINTNPSFERGTAGWGTIQAGTIGTTAAFQQFGAWAGSVAPTSNGTTGARSPTYTSSNGSDYTVSIYMRGANAIPYKIGVGDSAGANIIGSINITGGGTWHRYSFSYTEPSGATRAVAVKKNASADTSAFYLDGLQIEVGSLTTYIDGDQDGCYWQGVPHASSSLRSGTYRGGGSVVALEDLGFKPDDALGIGMPPLDTTDLSYALLDGGEFLQQRGAVRPFTLTCKPILGTSQADYHITRRTLINALKINLVDPQQPVRFWYTGGQGTVRIDAVLAGGLEGGQRSSPMTEEMAVRFIAHSPFWTATTQEGTALDPRVSIGSANFIVKRDPLGRWGTMGANGTTLLGVPNVIGGGDAAGGIQNMAMNPGGTLFFCGTFGSVAGTQSPNIGMYFPTTNAFGTLTGGTIDNSLGGVRKIIFAPSGSLYIGGNFNLAAGTSAKCLAIWNGAYGTFIGGSIGHGAGVGTDVRAMAINQLGTLFFGGRAWASVGGTANANSCAFWYAGSFGTMVGQTGIVRGLAVGLDNRIFAAVVTSVNGTTINGMAQWAGAWGSMGGGVVGGGGFARGIVVQPNGKLAVSGDFTTAGSATGANNLGEWNGVDWSKLEYGVNLNHNPSDALTSCIAVNPRTGNLYFGGLFNRSGDDRPMNDGFAFYNGYRVLPMDIDLSGNGTVNAILIGPDETIYAAGSFSGTAQAASVSQLNNSGMEIAYPTFKIRNTGAGTARPYQVVNTTTGDALYFDIAIQPGEELTLETTPGARSFTSDFRGNVFGKILGGSNIASFKLMPGTNWMSFFANSDSLVASVYWTPTHSSADGGTTY